MKTSLFKSLYFQVLTAIAIGILLGHFYPEIGEQMKPLGDGFVKLIKMIIAPVIFCTVVTGIAGMESMKAVGRTGAVALLYFEIVSTIALIIGLIIVNVVQPGAGMNVDPATLDAKAVAVYADQAKDQGIVAFIMDVIPASVIGAFASGNILQVLLFAVLFGFALHRLGSKGQLIFNVIESFSQVIFGIINMIMRLAPIGAFGAMAFTIGKYGVGTLVQLGQLIICFYITCILFVVLVLGSIAKATGFSIFKFIRYIREELLIVLGTSSSESALPRMLDKMEKLGCRKSVVGLVIPTGYSFNLDGTSIYLTMAAVFIAQATNSQMDILNALENHQFAIWLQPQVEMTSGKLVSAEVLLRIQQPDGSWDLPDGLIDRIECCGLMVTVGHWVLEESCRLLAAWQERGIMLPLSVNLSALQLMHPNMVADMLELLTRYRIQPGTLILEVTESRRIDDPHAAVAILRPLRNAGVRVALDDFGMGYAGLRQLQHMKSLPIDVLKIDKMFVEGLPGDSSMIAAIIMLAQSLNLQMIAEGVETEAQRDWLAKAGVGIAQGFLFARPLPIEIFEESYLEEK